MGNMLHLPICGMQSAAMLDDLDDISDATFDFISVAVCKPSSSASASTSKMVAVVPVAVAPETPTAPRSTLFQRAQDEPLSFNDRLNLLSWDVEQSTPSTSTVDTFVFDEYATLPINAHPIETNDKRKTRNWLQRVIKRCSNSSSKKPTPCAAVNQSKQQDDELVPDVELPLVASFAELASTCDDAPAACFEDTCKWQFGAYSDDDTEDSSSDDTESDRCSCYVRASSFDERSDDEYDWDMQSVDEHDPIEMDESDKQHGLCVQDYLGDREKCAAYAEIEYAVTNSNCWMNEQERQALCRILQAFSTYDPTIAFCKDMLAAAEECLVVLHGDQDAAFNAFVLLAQAKWQVSAW